MSQDYVSFAEVARRLHVVWRTARAMVRRGDIPGVERYRSAKDPRRVRLGVRREHFEKWLKIQGKSLSTR